MIHCHFPFSKKCDFWMIFHWQQHILHRRLELLLMLGLPLLWF
jgi:hypothetical protein